MRALCLASALLCLVAATARAGDSPRLFVLTVPEARFKAAQDRLADALVEQRAFANTAERRAWVMEKGIGDG